MDVDALLTSLAEAAAGRVASALVADAHAAGLAVHPWTVRAENRYLPATLRKGDDLAAHGDVQAVFKALYAAGVDGVFTDFPKMGVAARR